jgi:hypothetical protein
MAKPHRAKVRLPRFKLGKEVFLVNEAHKLHLAPAVVVARDHMHCRIRVMDGRRSILLWVPAHWLQEGFADDPAQ